MEDMKKTDKGHCVYRRQEGGNMRKKSKE